MRVILISGVPGAGKTTVARQLAARFPRSAHIETDLVGDQFIVSGLVPPQGPPADEAEAQLLLRRRNMCLLADSYAAAGAAGRTPGRGHGWTPPSCRWRRPSTRSGLPWTPPWCDRYHS